MATVAFCVRLFPAGACLACRLLGSCICAWRDELEWFCTSLSRVHVAHLTRPVLRFGCRLILLGAEGCLAVPSLQIPRTCAVHHLSGTESLAQLWNSTRIADNLLKDCHDGELLVFSTDLRCLAGRWC